ncbi:FecCD family ABC transporter permease [Streptococcus loxodontisalivarius]|uniref:Probable heme-iron transport system permease protein IsdF n=1 Tax=Streptococcus loxodontisalivarius TaxID=1349415 RepID=A0ABS2PSA1_9STRE|nr:iron ABC transporter permease [Streptococcus loxodontisalivarius]MBM7642916.1 iron complex transport system permease protein [Streptococcus loxodontisalivarius]
MRPSLRLLTLFLVFLLLLLYALSSGSLELSFSDLISALQGRASDSFLAVVDLRLPRILLAILVGMGLAISGLLLQVILKNPLADPSLIGINSGALLAKLLVLLAFPNLLMLSSALSLLGGLLVLAMIWVLSYRQSFSPLKVLITGLALNAALTALLDMAKLDPLIQLPAGFGQVSWADVRLATLLIPILVVYYLLGPMVEVLRFNDEVAIGLGARVGLYRGILIVGIALMASLSTALAGNIAFVGLLVPHLSSRLIGRHYRYFYPFTALLGASLMLLTDTLGRTLFLPLEIQASILFAFMGAPALIYLVNKKMKI